MIIVVIIIVKYLKTFTQRARRPKRAKFSLNVETLTALASILASTLTSFARILWYNAWKCKSMRRKKKRVTGPGYCKRKPRGTISTHHRQSGHCSWCADHCCARLSAGRRRGSAIIHSWLRVWYIRSVIIPAVHIRPFSSRRTSRNETVRLHLFPRYFISVNFSIAEFSSVI